MDSFKVAVVGARRVRQGTGEFIARAFARAGCRVEAIVGTSEASCEEARRGIRERHGIEARPYLSLAELLVLERPDVVAIASPAEHHFVDLSRALAFGCHVFCEKPLILSDPHDSAAHLRSITQDLVAQAESHGRSLAVNTQWPETLDAFRALHPRALDGPLETLEMWMCPMATGLSRIVDMAPHVLSLAYALAGEGTVGVVGPAVHGPRALDLPFEYRHARGTARVVLHTKEHPEPPRPAAYAINGSRVDRVIEPGYRQVFVSGDRRVPVPDPLDLCVARFVRSLETGARTDRFAIVEGMVQLQQLVSAVAANVGGVS